MPANIDESLLRDLGIIKPDGNRDNFNNFFEQYVHTNTEFLNSEHPAEVMGLAFNLELKATQALVEQAKISAASFLTTNGLQPELNAQGEPDYKIEWDPIFLALKMKLKIAGTFSSTKEHLLHYEGREIEITIANSASNNDFNSEDLIAQFQSRADAAISLLGGKDANGIHGLQKFSLLLLNGELINQANQASSSKTLSIQEAFKKLSRGTILKSHHKIINNFIINLAIEVIRQNKNDKGYNPTEAEILLQTQAIKQAEIDMISNKPRPILMDFYPQISQDNTLQYMHTINTPHSDVSSESRMLDKTIPANLWHTQLVRVKLGVDPANLNCYLLSRELYMQLFRSASLAQLNKTTFSRATELELESFNNLLKQKAREEIIAKINNDELKIADIKLGKHITISTAYISLLSQFIEKGKLTAGIAKLSELTKSKTAHKLGETLHHKNEHEQILSLMQALESSSKQQIKLSKADVDFIIEHTQDSRLIQNSDPQTIVKLKEFLQNSTIKHDEFGINFVSNLGTHNLDFNNNNYKYNLQGFKKLNKHLAKFLNKHGLQSPAALEQEGKPENWTSLQTSLKIIYDQQKNDTEVKRVIGLYIEVRNFVEAHSKWFGAITEAGANTLIIDSVIAAQKAALLADLLGFTVHAFCKSGKDRTGLFISGLEAKAAPDKFYATNIYRALHSSSAITEIPVLNGGGRVLQISPNLFEGLKAYNDQPLENTEVLPDLVDSWDARRVGKIGRFYPEIGDIRAYLNAAPKVTKVTEQQQTPPLTSPRRPPPIPVLPKAPVSSRTPVLPTKAPTLPPRPFGVLNVPSGPSLRPLILEQKKQPDDVIPNKSVKDLIKHWDKKNQPDNPTHKPPH